MNLITANTRIEAPKTILPPPYEKVSRSGLPSYEEATREDRQPSVENRVIDVTIPMDRPEFRGRNVDNTGRTSNLSSATELLICCLIVFVVIFVIAILTFALAMYIRFQRNIKIRFLE